MFCQTGMLDDVWFHRSYMIYGNDCGEGWGAYAGTRNVAPAGRIMVVDDTRAYAFRSDPLGNILHPRTTYSLYAADKDPGAPEPPEDAARRRRGEATGVYIQAHETHWVVESPPLLVAAMALAADTLFIAGPPDLADETAMLSFLPGAHDEYNRQLLEQEAAWRGERGGLMRAVSADTGATLAEYALDSVPVFDGLSIAEGRLLMSMLDGTLVCFAEE